MKTFEIVCKNLLSSRGNVMKIILGCFIGLFPVVNIACLGYLLQEAGAQIPSNDSHELPNWEMNKNSVIKFYKDGMVGLILLAIFFAGPMFLFYFLGICFSWLGEGFVSLGACLGMLTGSQLTAIAFLNGKHIKNRNIWKFISQVAKTSVNNTSIFIFPSLLFVGLQLAGIRILNLACLGATMFLGLILIVAFAKEALISSEQNFEK